MESLASSDSSGLYILLAIVAAAMVVSAIVQGLSMRVACSLCGKDDVGFFYGSTVSFFAPLGGAAVVVAISLLFRPTGPWESLLYSIAGAVTVLCVMLRVDPLRGLGIYILFGLILAVTSTVLCVFAALGVVACVPEDQLQKYAGQAKGTLVSRMGSLQRNDSAFGDSLDGESLQGLFFKSDDAVTPVARSGAGVPAATDSRLPKTRENPKISTPPLIEALPEGTKKNPFVP